MYLNHKNYKWIDFSSKYFRI